MTLNIPTHKTDNKSAVIARDFPVFDVPIKYDREFDYDDCKGIIDDLDNPFDKTIPVLARGPSIIILERGVEILGGKCTSCGVDNPMVLKIDPIQNYRKYSDRKTLSRLVENMKKKGNDSRKKFQILCQNCNFLKRKINEYRRSLGLPKITKVSSNLESLI